MLDRDGLGDDLLHGLLGRLVVEVREEEAGEVGVKTLVPRDEFVGEGEAGHEAALLEPEDRGEGAGEEDTLDGSERHQSLCECGALILDPADGPVGLLADTRDYFKTDISCQRSRSSRA